MIYAGIMISIPLFFLVIDKNITGDLLGVMGLLVAGALFFIFLKRSRQDQKRLLAIVIVLIFLIIFTAILNQGGTTLNLFIDRIINRHLFGLTIPTTFFYVLDPIFMLSIGSFLVMLWNSLAKRHKEPFVSTKFALGFLIFSLGFFCV